MNCVIKIKYIEEKKIIFIYENIYKKKMGPYKLRNLPVGGPVNMNQHQSWLMRNKK